MTKAQERRRADEQAIQEHKAKKNKYIIAAVFWILSSLYISFTDLPACVLEVNTSKETLGCFNKSFKSSSPV